MVNDSKEIAARHKDDHYTTCGDCGSFVAKDMWVPKDHEKYTHAMCRSCLSEYDCTDGAYH